MTSNVFDLTSAVEPLPVAVTVTIPADIGVTDRFVPKSIVPAVPTTEPLFFTTTPEPVSYTHLTLPTNREV